MFRYLLYSSFHLEPMSISKTAFFGAEEFISPLTDVPRRLRECSIFRKKSWKILDLSMTPPSHFKLNLLMSTIHRSPLADDQKTRETTTDDGRHTSTMTISTNNDGCHSTTNPKQPSHPRRPTS